VRFAPLGGAVNRRWLFWVLLALFAWLVVSRVDELAHLEHVLARGAWQWVGLAAALEVAHYCANGYLSYRAMRLAGVGGSYLSYVPLAFAALFVNVTLPAAGASGIALYADSAARRGDSPAKATAGALLTHVINQVSFVPYLLWLDLYLAARGALSAYHGLISVLFYLFALSQVGALLLAVRHPRELGVVLGKVEAAVNWVARALHRTQFLSEGWAERSAGEFAMAADPLRRSPRQVLALLGVSAAVHTIPMAVLAAMFQAFAAPAHAALPAVAYVVSFLFVTISITPQGVGFVEEAMTSTLLALGVPGAEAAILPFAYRGLSLWLPLAIGFLSVRRMSAAVAVRRPARAAWLVRASAALVAGVAALDVLWAVLPPTAAREARLQAFRIDAPGGVSRTVTVLAGFALLANIRGLLQRRRVAWRRTLALLAVSVVSDLFLRFDYAGASLALGTLLLLAFQRGSYYARGQVPRWADALRVMTLALAYTLSLAAGCLLLLHSQFAESPNWMNALRYVPAFLGFAGGPTLTPTTGHARLMMTVVRRAGAVTVGYAILLALWAATRRPPATQAERARVEETVRVHGTCPLAHLALFPDKSYSFGPGGSVIQWVREGRVALALGDPIAPAGASQAAIGTFAAQRRAAGLLPAFHLVSDELLDAYRRAGLRAVLIGYETAVPLARLDRDPQADPALRSSEQRLAQRGHTLWAYLPPLPNAVMDELETISEEWLRSRRQSEVRFSVGWYDEATLRTCPVMVVRDAAGALTAFASILIGPRGEYATLNVLRHRSDAMPGTMEYLLLATFRWAALRGARRFSLGLTLPLDPQGMDAQQPDGEAARRLSAHLRTVHGLQALRHLYLRFAPEPSPRYLAYAEEAGLGTVVDAIIAADLGVRTRSATIARLVARRPQFL